MEDVLISKVSPSGAARDTTSVPMTAPAPGRFSISIAGPCAPTICCTRTRARVSVGPPAAYGTMSLIVFAACGQTPWLQRKMPEEAAATAIKCRNCRPKNFMASIEIPNLSQFLCLAQVPKEDVCAGGCLERCNPPSLRDRVDEAIGQEVRLLRRTGRGRTRIQRGRQVSL